MEFVDRKIGGTYRLILKTDPALNQGAEDFEDRYRMYIDTGEESHLPMHPGQAPVRFVLKRLFGRAEVRLKEKVRRGYESERGIAALSLEVYYLAAQLALEKVEGLSVKEGGAFSVQTVTDDDKMTFASENTMGLLQSYKDASGHRNLVELIGGEVIRRTFYAPLS